MYPKSVSVLKAAQVRIIGEYVLRRRHTIYRTIADQPILEECKGVERQQESPPHLYCWEQEIELNLDEGEEEDDKDDGVEVNALLEALPVAGGVFNTGAISEALTEMEGVTVPSPDQRDPR